MSASRLAFLIYLGLMLGLVALVLVKLLGPLGHLLP